jgi:chorismate-pyruvate lyase
MTALLGCRGADASGPTDDSEPVAVLGALHAALLRHDSATVALERWCLARGAAGRMRVVAEPVRCPAADPTDDQRRRLQVGPADLVRYRRVRLSIAGRVLSEAENWYVPGRLTTGMNRLLASTDTPFGRVVRHLRFRRHLLAADVLWPAAEAGAPGHVLRHRALLVGADGAPISEVLETYMWAALFLEAPPD